MSHPHIDAQFLIKRHGVVIALVTAQDNLTQAAGEMDCVKYDHALRLVSYVEGYKAAVDDLLAAMKQKGFIATHCGGVMVGLPNQLMVIDVNGGVELGDYEG